MNKSTIGKVINRFERACDAKSWSGSQPPEDLRSIEKEYDDAKASLRKALEK